MVLQAKARFGAATIVLSARMGTDERAFASKQQKDSVLSLLENTDGQAILKDLDALKALVEIGQWVDEDKDAILRALSGWVVPPERTEKLSS